MQSGTTVYTLEHHGWIKGVEVFRNRFYASVQRGPDTPIEELEAVARLMTAAPDLIAALTQIQLMAEIGEYGIADIARAAIAKATGA